MSEKDIIVIDFGSRYIQNIIDRLKELNANSILVSYDVPCKKVEQIKPAGIIFSGSPNSIHTGPKADVDLLNLGIPVLGICYGLQFIAKTFGGEVQSGERELGCCTVNRLTASPLLENLPDTLSCWMNHSEYVTSLPSGFKIIAKTSLCSHAAIEDEKRKIYGVQFHPEVSRLDEHGHEILKNFLHNICSQK